MLYDKHIDEELLMVDVDPLISPAKVKLNDLLTFAIALNFIYNGVEPDNIASDMEKNMYINGFNFDTDWSDIYNYLQNRHFINNNYLNEIHEYSYVNEYGETITNEGYGMSPMNKGWMTEWFDDFVVYGTIYDEKTKEYKEAKTYNEVIRKKKCYDLTRYFNLTDENLNEIYDFLSEDNQNVIFSL